jgi:polygalacturonase
MNPIINASDMKPFKLIIFLLLAGISIPLQAKDYKASLFSIKSDGVTLNTTSIQKAIDYISENGGGRLVFYVGRYLTGSIFMKDNVTIQLQEGAILVGSPNPFDYEKVLTQPALILAHNRRNIGITGKGVVDGQGFTVANNILDLVYKGLIKDNLADDRPGASRPFDLYFRGCTNVRIQGVTFRDPCAWTLVNDQCRNVVISQVTLDSKAFWNNDGIDIVDCDSVSITRSYIDAADDGICLKSQDPASLCRNVYVYNNTIRSSANGIKFGTASYGGFKDIKIINNLVFDTYRSAITISAVDGAAVDNIIIDSLRAVNTGNAIFLSIGERQKGKKGKMSNISISNLYVEVPATKPDAGYRYEGPVEDMPRNISPATITGMPDARIENVSLKNIEIHYPGGGNANFSKVGLDQLDSIPEVRAGYPEFSMFKELPAWGFFIRHVKNIRFENVTMVCGKTDYRTAVVLSDVQGVSFKALTITEPGPKKDPLYPYKSTGVVIEK